MYDNINSPWMWQNNSVCVLLYNCSYTLCFLMVMLSLSSSHGNECTLCAGSVKWVSASGALIKGGECSPGLWPDPHQFSLSPTEMCVCVWGSRWQRPNGDDLIAQWHHSNSLLFIGPLAQLILIQLLAPASDLWLQSVQVWVDVDQTMRESRLSRVFWWRQQQAEWSQQQQQQQSSHWSKLC